MLSKGQVWISPQGKRHGVLEVRSDNQAITTLLAEGTLRPKEFSSRRIFTIDTEKGWRLQEIDNRLRETVEEFRARKAKEAAQ